MSLEPDSDPAMLALRRSHALLDERPSAATRRRILESAAKRDAVLRKIATPLRRSPADYGYRLAPPRFAGAAALGVAAALAFGIALHVQQAKHAQHPNVGKIAIAENSAPAQVQPPSGAAVPPMASGSPLSVPRTEGSDDVAVHRSEGERGQTAKPLADSAPPALPTSEGTVDSERRVSIDRRDIAQQVLAASASTAPDLTHTPAGAAAADLGGGSTSATAAKSKSSTLPAMIEGDRALPTTQNASVGTPAGLDAPLYRNSEKAWIERIRELRKARLYDQADAELKLFQRAHPQAVVPEDLRTP